MDRPDYSAYPCETLIARLEKGELRIVGKCGKPATGYLFPGRYFCANCAPKEAAA